jgi:hypothetical protein
MHARGADRGRIALLLIAAGLCSGLCAAASMTEYVRMFENNRRLLRDYSWVSRTEISLDGELQSVERYRVSVRESGSRERTAIEPDPEGASDPKIGRKRERQQETLRESLQSLIESYIDPSERTARELFGDAFVWRGAAREEGQTRVQARHLVRQGDQVSLWLDSVTEEPMRLEILTSLDGEPVRVTTEFGRIKGGPFYPARVVVETEVKEKKLVMTTVTDDYRLVSP